MNGFELKEKIEAVKKQIKENERLVTRDPTVIVIKSQEGEKEPESLAALFERRLVLQQELLQLEVKQEKFNLETTLKNSRGEVLTLAECIKLRGMLDSSLKLVENGVLLLEGVDSGRNRMSLTKDSSWFPGSRYEKQDGKKLPRLIEEISEILSNVKALIAEGNSKTV